MDSDAFREILLDSPCDVWGIIDAAVSVASKDYPNELKRRRDGIAEKLYGQQLNDEHKSSSDSDEEEDELIYIECPVPDFSNFDRDKAVDCFAADQFWAIYDTMDGMPRIYARIRKVFSSPFRLITTWLDADPEKPQEIVWANGGLPVACGKFTCGETEETRNRLMFSHQIACEKGSKRSSFVVYPQKGEIWALYRDWDINWSSDPKSHMEYKYEIVEVLSDFDKKNGVLVAYMVKLEGFVNLFQRTPRKRLAKRRIPSRELFRFSHHRKSLKLTGKEREDVPVGSFELDTASLPDDLDELFSNNVKSKPVKVSARTRITSCHQSPERLDNELSKDMLNVTRSPRGIKRTLEQSNGSFEKSDNGGSEAIIIHDFKVDQLKWKFQEGQIWALNIGCYAQIIKLESSPLRLHVDLLVCSDAIRPNPCGLYIASEDESHIFQQDSFLYLVKADFDGKKKFGIYPRDKEVWVLYNNEDTMLTLSDLKAGDCDIVEVCENNGYMIKVLSLSHVPGYKSVFKANKVLEIPLDQSKKFYYRIPVFLLTEKQDGRLRGMWELDLTEFPGLLPT